MWQFIARDLVEAKYESMSTSTPPATITPSISLVPVDSIATQYAVNGTATKLRNDVRAKYVRFLYDGPMTVGYNQRVVFGLKLRAPLEFATFDASYQCTVKAPDSTGTFRYGIGSSDVRELMAVIPLNTGQKVVAGNTTDKIEFFETRENEQLIGVMRIKDMIVDGEKCIIEIFIESKVIWYQH